MNRSPELPKIASPTLHVTIGGVFAAFVTTIIIACIFKVEVVARGEGRVIPVSRVQIVQAEFGGKITSIYVRDGSEVREGDVLIELDNTSVDAEINTITSEINRLRIERARLTDLSLVDIEGKNEQENIFSALTLAVFDAGLDTKHDFYEQQRQLFEAETADLRASIDRINARISANKKSIEVTQASIEQVNATIDIQRERLTSARELFERGASSRLAFLDVQERFTSKEKERNIYHRELEEKRMLTIALQAEQLSLITEKRNQILQRTSEIEGRLSILDDSLRTAQRRKMASRLIAPKDGIVEQLEIFTIGAIASAGDPLLRVVPIDGEIEIDGVFTNTDIGFIDVGQQANIGLHAYPSGRFGYVEGVVTEVSADARPVGNGWGFNVRIAPTESVLRKGDDVYSLRPGMTATLLITTEKRRIITYFFAPIVETIQGAMGER